MEGQFRPMTPPMNSLALLTQEELKDRQEVINKDRAELAGVDAESRLGSLDTPSRTKPERVD
jgi:hypothetical protein